MLVTLILGAVGATMIGRTLLTSGWSDDERTALALGLAFTLVAGPAYVVLLRFARGRLRDDVGERTSLAWAAYLNVALASSLIVSIVTVHQLLEGVFGVDDFEWRGIAPVVVWAAVWTMHWSWLRRSDGLRGDLHLAVGSFSGLVTMLIGIGGVAYVAGDEIYTSVVDQLPTGHLSPTLGTWLIAAGVGAVVWSWHWLGYYLRAERTSLWYVYVLLIGTLGGLIAAICLRRHDRLLDRRLVPRQPRDATAERTLRARARGRRRPGRRDGQLALPPNRSAQRRLGRALRAAQGVRLSDGGFRSPRERRGRHARARRTARVDRLPDHRRIVRRREQRDPRRRSSVRSACRCGGRSGRGYVATSKPIRPPRSAR